MHFPSPATPISLAALVIAGAGTSYAVINRGIPDRQGIFHACVNRRSGVVRIVSNPAACRRARPGQPGEQTVAWAKVGPTGPRGATGPSGPSDGYYTAEVSGTSEVTAAINVPAGSYIAAARCTATNIRPDPTSTTTRFGLADSTLSATPPADHPDASLPTDLAQASVPDAGYQGFGHLGSNPVVAGDATLSTNQGFRLPFGGSITDTCEDGIVGPQVLGGSQVAGMSYTLKLTAIKVANLHVS